MTKTTRKVLVLLHLQGTVTATQVAYHLWPDHDGWSRVSRAGTRGSTRGSGMWRAAGCLLGKLAKRGLVERQYGYFLGKKGQMRTYNRGYRLTPAGKAKLLVERVRMV